METEEPPLAPMSDLLAEMRLAFNDVPMSVPPTPAEKGVRDLLKKNPKEFFAQYGSALKDWEGKNAILAEKWEAARAAEKKSQLAVAGTVEPEKPDEGSERVLELIDKILSEWEMAK